MDHVSATIAYSRDLGEAIDRMLTEAVDWMDRCRHELVEVLPIDNHDQGTFASGWEPVIRFTGDREAVSFMKKLRDDTARFYGERGDWRHGYWRMQEAHHGTEHFELFLGALWRLDPSDRRTVEQLLDAAEHIGNFSSDVPDWFDPKTAMFLGLHFGADGVRPPAKELLNYPDHLRLVNIALLAHEMTGGAQYLELARRHTGRWADYLASGEIPYAIAADRPLFGDIAADPEYRRVVGQAAMRYTRVNAAEQFLASGVIGTMLKLHRLTGEERFLLAGRTLLDTLAPELCDPDAGVVAAALLDYREITNDHRFDHYVLAAASSFTADCPELTLTRAANSRHANRPDGVGKRADKPQWTVAGKPLACHPIALAAAAVISRDPALAAAAMDLGRVQLHLARQIYPHGHHHGCSAETVSAIARGHGRENNAGVLTAVFAPIVQGFGIKPPQRWRPAAPPGQ